MRVYSFTHVCFNSKNKKLPKYNNTQLHSYIHMSVSQLICTKSLITELAKINIANKK